MSDQENIRPSLLFFIFLDSLSPALPNAFLAPSLTRLCYLFSRSFTSYFCTSSSLHLSSPSYLGAPFFTRHLFSPMFPDALSSSLISFHDAPSSSSFSSSSSSSLPLTALPPPPVLSPQPMTSPAGLGGHGGEQVTRTPPSGG